ncbi:MAG TPA: Gfo/Idh/MocA family oxidoreductase, partial [Caldilineaceae bacterium]|nr:Gfo/Idh/MocA family oxidoreductase [Caldilineaceae bacterium]
MTESVRVGVIGTSWYADMMHLPTLQSHSQAEIAAICGRNREPAEVLAKKYAIPAIYSDYREMIEQGNLDAVVVATPDDLHYPMVMAALDAGLHVICEKPLASTVA